MAPMGPCLRASDPDHPAAAGYRPPLYPLGFRGDSAAAHGPAARPIIPTLSRLPGGLSEAAEPRKPNPIIKAEWRFWVANWRLYFLPNIVSQFELAPAPCRLCVHCGLAAISYRSDTISVPAGESPIEIPSRCTRAGGSWPLTRLMDADDSIAVPSGRIRRTRRRRCS